MSKQLKMRVVFDLVVEDDVEIDELHLANSEKDFVVTTGGERTITDAVKDYETVAVEEVQMTMFK